MQYMLCKLVSCTIMANADVLQLFHMFDICHRSLLLLRQTTQRGIAQAVSVKITEASPDKLKGCHITVSCPGTYV